MPTKTEDATNAFTEAVVSSVKQGQELAFSGISAWADLTGKAEESRPGIGLPVVADQGGNQ